MSWEAIIGAGASLVPGGGAVASLAGGVVSSVLGATTSRSSTEDGRAAEAGGLGLDLYQLGEVFRRGSYLGRSVASWSSAAPASQDARQFFRVTAAAVGAIDGGYRQRGDAGNRAALTAAESWADAVDRTAGTALGVEVRNQNPGNFIRKVAAVGGQSSGSGLPVVSSAPAPAAVAADWAVGGSVNLGSGRPSSGVVIGAVVLAVLIVVALLLRGR